MARRKPDWEVGPLGVWAYNTRILLGRSSAQVAAAVGVGEVTIRKVEGGSAKPGADLLRRIYAYFQKLSAEQHVPIDPPPTLEPVKEAAEDPVAAAIDRQTEVMREILAVLRTLAPATPGTLVGAAASAQTVGQRQGRTPARSGPESPAPTPGQSPRETGGRP